MTTKRDLVDRWIKTRVDRAVNELAGNAIRNGAVEYAKHLADNRHTLGVYVAVGCTGTYDFLELDDIMHWRKRKVND